MVRCRGCNGIFLIVLALSVHVVSCSDGTYAPQSSSDASDLDADARADTGADADVDAGNVDAGDTGGDDSSPDGAEFDASDSDEPNAVAARIGVFSQGNWRLDIDGDGVWGSPEDKTIEFGLATDIPVVGDWNGDGRAKLGIRRGAVFYLDFNGNGFWDAGDVSCTYGFVTDQPVVGDFNGDGRTEIGIRRENVWHLDFNGNGTADSGDRALTFGLATDTPVVGDWNGDGKDELGVRRGAVWYLDSDGSGTLDETDSAVTYGLAADIPVVGDFNGDGVTDIGVRRGTDWHLDANGNGVSDVADAFFSFGLETDTPIVGDWLGSGTSHPHPFCQIFTSNSDPSAGQPVILSWVVSNATSAVLDPAPGGECPATAFDPASMKSCKTSALTGTNRFGLRLQGADSTQCSITIPLADTPPAPLDAIEWLARKSTNRGVWVRRRLDQAEPELFSTLYRSSDRTSARKQIQVQQTRPWASPPELVRFVDPYWTDLRSGNIWDGEHQEEVYVPGLRHVPEKLVADGLTHTVGGCYTYSVYTSDYSSCNDVEGATYRGTNIMANTRYTIYHRCLANQCDGQSVSIRFGQEALSVLRIQYDLMISACDGALSLTEEQWYCRGYGWCGFYNTSGPQAVDFVAFVDEDACISSLDGYCHEFDGCIGP